MSYLPVFTVDSHSHLRKLQSLLAVQSELKYGLLLTVQNVTRNLWAQARSIGCPLYLDSGVFEQKNRLPWYLREERVWTGTTWQRSIHLKPESELRHILQLFLDRCAELQPDSVFAPDVWGKPLISLHLARLSWLEWQQSSLQHSCTLIGVVQAGKPLYHWRSPLIPGGYASPPPAAIDFVGELVTAYRAIGYSQIALGGLLKADPKMPMGLKFGLSLEDFDRVLSAVSVDFVLGGLSLSRIPLLQRHGVAADSTNWLWWNSTYDAKRFQNQPLLGTA